MTVITDRLIKRASTIVLARVALGSLLLLGACTPTPQTANAAPRVVFLVSFATDASVLDAEGEKVVGQAARYLLAHPGTHAAVIGRADSTGPLASNQSLSKRRAEAVRDAIVVRGPVAVERLETHWTGELREALTVGLETPSAKNRVVDITIQ